MKKIVRLFFCRLEHKRVLVVSRIYLDYAQYLYVYINPSYILLIIILLTGINLTIYMYTWKKYKTYNIIWNRYVSRVSKCRYQLQHSSAAVTAWLVCTYTISLNRKKNNKVSRSSSRVSELKKERDKSKEEKSSLSLRISSDLYTRFAGH